MLRALFSLAASCYIIAALVFPALWLRDAAHLPSAVWWPVYLGLELPLVGLPIAYAVWQLVWAPAAALEAIRPAHLARLVLMTLLVVYGFLVVPVACFIALRSPGNVVAGCAVFGAAAIGTMVYLRRARQSS